MAKFKKSGVSSFWKNGCYGGLSEVECWARRVTARLNRGYRSERRNVSFANNNISLILLITGVKRGRGEEKTNSSTVSGV